MNDNLEHRSDISDVLRKEVHLPVARLAGWHNSYRVRDASGKGIPFYLQLGYRTRPQQICNFFRKLPGSLR